MHALLGENGAGKTTLMRIAYGMIRPDRGEIAVTGGAIAFRAPAIASPAAARAAGIGMVHQHFTSVPALSVGENVALFAGWRETGRAAERRAAELIDRLRLPLDPTVPAERLGVQLRQRLEIVKALAAEARILLLDEPSAVLAPREVQQLLQSLRAFAATGGEVVLITHKLGEALQAADRITVLRRGRVAWSGDREGQTADTLARAMLGDASPVETAAVVAPGSPDERPAPDVASPRGVVRARQLSLASSDDGVARVRDASFEWHGGEIVGIAAVEGNGQRELLRTLAGLDQARVVAGTLEISGSAGFVPEDRTTEGLIPAFTVAENLLLGALPDVPAIVDWNLWRRRAGELLTAYDIRAAGAEAPVASLSGGNQQRLVLARALSADPDILVAEDPTRGLDIRATAAVHARLRDAARRGLLVVVYSSDLDEVLQLADRIVVIAAGALSEVPAGTGRDRVGDAMLGVVRAA